MIEVIDQMEKAMQEAFKLPVRVRWIEPAANAAEAFQKLANAIMKPDGKESGT